MRPTPLRLSFFEPRSFTRIGPWTIGGHLLYQSATPCVPSLAPVRSCRRNPADEYESNLSKRHFPSPWHEFVNQLRLAPHPHALRSVTYSSCSLVPLSPLQPWPCGCSGPECNWPQLLLRCSVAMGTASSPFFVICGLVYNQLHQSYNSLGQNPCLVWGYMMSTCFGGRNVPLQSIASCGSPAGRIYCLFIVSRSLLCGSR